MKRPLDLMVLPKPQKVTFHGGRVRRPGTYRLDIGRKRSGSLVRWVRQFAQRNRLSSSRQTARSIVISLKPDGAAFPKEGYSLHIDDRIVLNAGDEAGVFYGLQTFQQIFDNAKVLPRCTIEDWPALAVRGFYFDLTRQVPTVDFLKTIVDRLAAVKINTLMIQYREFFPYEGFPFIVSAQSYTRDEISEFVQYARDRHIQIVPLLQSLSFQEHILRNEVFAHLREDPRDISAICPTHPQTMGLYRALAEQLIDAHATSVYFHLGGDEANTVLSPRQLARQRKRRDHKRRPHLEVLDRRG